LIDMADAKAEAFIEILNKSDHYILFKVSSLHNPRPHDKGA
jgi:hypothetical protein